MTKLLMREVHIETAAPFSFASLAQRANDLSPIQKQLFDQVWNHFVATGKPYPYRSLPHIIGKQPIGDAFKELNGSLIYETHEEGDRGFKLTAYGAFLTGHGQVLAVLLVRLLDLIKDLYTTDTFLKLLDRESINNRLNLSDAELKLLFKLLQLVMPPAMPMYLSNWSDDGGDWTITITDDVVSLFNSDETVAYLDERLSAGYRPDKPYAITAQEANISNVLPRTVSLHPFNLQAKEQMPAAQSIFIVHGHDEAALQEVARFLEKLKLNAIILHERANEGQTIIEKFEKHAKEASFAVVLLTPDDVGYPADDPASKKARARQNVILELGFFVGRLGRNRVVALNKGVEIPSDLHGGLYEPMDSGGGWRLRVAQEIAAGGIDVDLNRLRK